LLGGGEAAAQQNLLKLLLPRGEAALSVRTVTAPQQVSFPTAYTTYQNHIEEVLGLSSVVRAGRYV